MVQTPEQGAIATLIVEVLNLRDVIAADIDPEAILFEDSGLGLDSIDALELALAIQSEFGVRAQENDEKNREYFHSVKSLAEFIRAKQQSVPVVQQTVPVVAASALGAVGHDG